MLSRMLVANQSAPTPLSTVLVYYAYTGQFQQPGEIIGTRLAFQESGSLPGAWRGPRLVYHEGLVPNRRTTPMSKLKEKLAGDRKESFIPDTGTKICHAM